MLSVEQALDEAGQLLARPGGWMQGDYCNGISEEGGLDDDLAVATSYCALGAVLEVNRRHYGARWRLNFEVCSMLRRLNFEVCSMLQAALGRGTSIQDWNDEPGRTQAEVVELFEKARALAAEKGI